jgi:hypothetical protein
MAWHGMGRGLLRQTRRQSANDCAKAGTLLAIRDNGRLRFPLCQFDYVGPDGVAPGLAEVLQALHLPALAKAAWLKRPRPDLQGQSPITRFKQGVIDGLITRIYTPGEWNNTALIFRRGGGARLRFDHHSDPGQNREVAMCGPEAWLATGCK